MEILDDNVPIRKQGLIMKQGGAEGGHKSWRERVSDIAMQISTGKRIMVARISPFRKTMH